MNELENFVDMLSKLKVAYSTTELKEHNEIEVEVHNFNGGYSSCYSTWTFDNKLYTLKNIAHWES